LKARLPGLTVVSARGLSAERIAVFRLAGDDGAPPNLAPSLSQAVGKLRSAVAGKAGRVAETAAGGARPKVVEVRGLGDAGKLEVRALEQALRGAVEAARAAGTRRLGVVMPAHALLAGAEGAERALRWLLLADYRFDRFRSERPRGVDEIQVVAPAGEERRYRAAVETASAVAEASAWARDLANTPPNEADPAWVERQARALAKRHGMKMRVFGPADLKRLRMGGILGVGAGSAKPPRMLRLEWGRGSRTVALVGKGVTFDTGGISIKPAAAMDEMKYDKCGATTVLGVLHAVAELALPLRLRVYVPLAENMPDGAAYRPGDILSMHNGKTVEITNTDAEGRLLLADALAYAAAEKPDALVEYSTLTGACVVALGLTGAGLFSPDDSLAAELLDAASGAGERLWRLPLWPEFGEEMKGTHADLRNSGGRWGGASTAGAFLSSFVGATKRWAHLDIAGPAYVGGDGKGPKGATGYGIATTVRWLRSLAR
jgi:leucyl aminopeptidase